MSLNAAQENQLTYAMGEIVRINQEFFINKMNRNGDTLSADEYFRELDSILRTMYVQAH